MSADPGHELREIDRADVLRGGVVVARLERLPDGSVAFAYVEDYDGPAITWSLPVDAPPRVTTNGGLPPFFTNLLPEGRRHTALRRLLSAAADDDLTMLLAVGGDLVGDVQVAPAGASPRTSAEIPRRPADFSQLRFNDLRAEALGPDGLTASGVAGVQDKVSSSMITLPMARAYLLKLNPPDYPFLVENEAFFLAAARESGLRTVAATVVRDRDDVAGLQVTRFDRLEDGRRLAVEDGCQVLDVHPSRKYSVTSEDLVTAVAERCGAPAVARRDLFAQLVHAYLSGNGDAHAKNFSIVQDLDGEWRVAPAYDLPSSRPYGDTTSALTIGGRGAGLSRAAFLRFADAIALPERAATRVLDQLLDGADRWVARLDELPFDTKRRHDLRVFLLDRHRALRAAS